MSFLTRIAMRAGIPAGGAAEPVLVPKDRGIQRPNRLSRQEAEPEEEQVQTLRRQPEIESDEEEVQTLRRRVEGQDHAQEAARAPLAPPTSEEQAPEARAGGRGAASPPAEEAQAIRRIAAPEEHEETVGPGRIDRRAGEQGEEHAPPAPPLLGSAVVRRSVRRAPAPGPEGLGPEISPATVSDEPEPPNLRPPGEAPPMRAASLPAVPVPTADWPDRSDRGGGAPMAALPPQPFAAAHAEPLAGRFERPQVVIDRLDVLIHEAMPPARAPDSDKRRSRSFRARYLRRL